MDTINWLYSLLALLSWAAVYCYFAVRKDFSKATGMDMEDEQILRFSLLLLHSFFYFTLIVILARAGIYFHEVAALSTIVLFAFVLYVGEEIGITQTNRSLTALLPEEESIEEIEEQGKSERDRRAVYYKNEWQEISN